VGVREGRVVCADKKVFIFDCGEQARPSAGSIYVAHDCPKSSVIDMFW